MPFYSLKFVSKKEVAERTTAFFFEKPRNFNFVPGQFIEIQLNKNLTHEFSIASSPKEKELMVTTRMRPTKFKKTLGKLRIGAKIRIEGPFGQFVLHKNKKIPAVLIAGGIGITPFRSMIKSFPDRKIILFYSNRKKKDAPFLKELKNLGNKSFKIIATMTKEPIRQAQGKNGKHINPKMIKDNVKDWQKAICYVVGSTGFVQSMADMLSKMKIEPDRVKTENFPGY